MSLIAVEAAIVVSDANVRNEIVERTAALQAATRNDEPGCLVYCFAPDPIQPDLIQVFELWENEAALAAHFLHSNYAGMLKLLGETGMTSAVSRKHRIDATAPVYGPDRRPTAEFD